MPLNKDNFSPAFIFSQLTESKKRKQEIREVRIKSVQDFMDFTFRGYWAMLLLMEEKYKDNPNNITIDILIKGVTSYNSSPEFLDLGLAAANGKSLHDRDLDNLFNEIGTFSEEIADYPVFEKTKIKDMKEFIEKNFYFRDKLVNLSSRIFKRLDILRNK